MTAIKTLLDHVKQAHGLSGAPGDVVRVFADGRYQVKLQYGVKTFRTRTHGVGDPRVTVMCSWNICGDRQRRQATSTR